jgi:hypothetical protein
MPTIQEYRYHTKAVAAYGRIERPFTRDIPGLAATTLIGGGPGYESAREERYRIEEIFRFDAAYTQVAGNEGPENVYNTLVTATIEKLNVADMITADVVTARLTGEYHTEDYEHFKGPWVSPLGSSFVNLRIAGRPYDVKLPPGFAHNLRSPASYQTYRKRRMEAKAEPAVSALDSGVLRIPGFGTITLARLAVVEHADPQMTTRIHRLSMLVLELGSPIDARMSIGEVESDGGGWP